MVEHRKARLALSVILVVGGLSGAATLASPAQASEAIESFTTTSSTSQAGGHPDLETSFSLSSPGVPEAARNVVFNAPRGLAGNTNAVEQCTTSSFALDECPTDSQAGLITVRARYEGNPGYLLGTAPIYVLVPQEGEVARFAFIVPTLNIPIAIPLTVRTASDYGLRFSVSDISQLTPLSSAKLIIWGFPASSIHDSQRFVKGAPGEPAGCPALADASCTPGLKANIPNDPLTINPTTCTGESPITSLEVQTYQDPQHNSTAQDSYPPITGCENEDFNPVIEASLTTGETDAPSGLNLELKAHQFEGLSASPSELRSSTLTLPPDLTINPDAADGQSACTDAQANFDSEGPAECPDNSKIGTFAIGSPTLDGPLAGSVYIGEPKPGNQYRLFMTASGFGMNIKLIGRFRPDPETGRVTAYFEELPQLPFETFQIHLFASDRGLMATPTACTFYTISADVFPWNASRADQTSSQVFGLDSGPHGSECPGQIRPFEPNLVAGTSNPSAGGFSSFTLKLDREDGDQYLGKLNFTMPPGLTANLHGITYCPEASIATAANTAGRAERMTPSCLASSQIGTTNVAAGPGTHPFHAVGKVYMAGPFKGAPLSLVAITPALAGPYDYGTVVVRVALHIDPLDAHVVADSEVVPSIIGGIPIRMRSIQVNIDRSNFMINPTNCSPFSIDSQGIGDQGAVADFSSYFHAVDCSNLGFKPKMEIRQLGGHRNTRRAANPSLQFDLNTRPGDANIKSISVTLPKALEIDQSHLGNLCARSELETTRCEGRQPIGIVKDETPLLEKPLEGLAYAVSGYGKLPHVAFILGGQVTVLPQGESETIGSGLLRTTVPVIPDVPIGHFQLTLYGGKKGYLSNTRNLCQHAVVASIEYSAQSGKKLIQRVAAKTTCAGKAKQHRRR